MFRKSYHPILTKAEISRLRGGKKRNRYYFVAILESAESDVVTDIQELKLQNQMATQNKSSDFPEGYEPFETIFGTAKLSLSTMTMPVPRLKLSTVWQNPFILETRMPACILRPSRNTEAFRMLKAEAALGKTKARIRHHAAQNRTKFDLVLSLLAYEATAQLMADPADRFEAFLWHRTPEFLRDLLALLNMPEAPSKPTEPTLLQAA